MNCFPCFGSSQTDEDIHDAHVGAQPRVARTTPPQHQGYIMPWSTPPEPKVNKDDANSVDASDIEANQFSFRELATATKNFRQECLIGECGYGRIYKGTLQPSGKVVTVKRLDKNRAHGNKEFLGDVLMLSHLRHSNLLDLVGYCADGDQRLLVYEYMPIGSLKEHLLDMDEEKKSLDWATRLKIACGIAKGIEYLHDKANPAVIYRDLKCTNVMLDEDFNPKLSDHGLAKFGGGNSKSQGLVLGNFGYCAPEYEKHGELTVKSDVYNFGVVLLELITGRGVLDTSKDTDEQNLVKWAQPIFRDPRRYPELADPRLSNSFPVQSLNQVVGIAALCLQDEPDVRPWIGDVVAALTPLTNVPLEVPIPVTIPQKKAPSRKNTSNASRRYESDYSEDSSCSWSHGSDDESDHEIPYKSKHNQIDAEILYHKKQNDQKDTGMDEQIGYREDQYDQEDSDTDEESDYEIQYEHNHPPMEEEIGYSRNQYDQKDTYMDEEIGYRTNQYNQQDTRMHEENGCKTLHDHMVEDRQKHYDQNKTRMGKEITYRQNQYELEYVSSDEESDYDQNEDEHKVGENEEHGYNKNQYERNYCMDEESGSDYDSDSSHEDIILGSRQSSRNRSARLDSKGKNDMILKDENIGSYSKTSSNNVGLDNGNVYEKNQSFDSYAWQSSIGRSGNGRTPQSP